MAVSSKTSRRGFLAALGLAVPAVASGLTSVLPGIAEARVPVRSIALQHRHTGEALKIVYFADGRYLEDSLENVNHFLRDWRTDEVIEYDPKVLDIIYVLQRLVDPSGPIEVFSGYRSPATNAMLRRASYGVAKNSLHMFGMAVDLHFPGRPLELVRKAALQLQAGGVGYYPASDFIHVDSGPVRDWAQGGRVVAGTDGDGVAVKRYRAGRVRPQSKRAQARDLRIAKAKTTKPTVIKASARPAVPKPPAPKPRVQTVAAKVSVPVRR